MIELYLILLLLILVILLVIFRRRESFKSIVSPSEIPILIISSPEHFSRSKERLNNLGFKDVKRIPPVYLKDRGNCQTKNLSLSELGVTKAHHSCFKEVLKINKNAIILEEDWRYSLSDDLFLKKLLDYYDYFSSNDLDILWLGYYHDSCTHSYIVSPRSLNMVLNVNYCNKPVDMILYGLCRKKSLKCFKASNEVHDNKIYYGQGLVFQDRKNIKGMHDHNNDRTSRFIL